MKELYYCTDCDKYFELQTDIIEKDLKRINFVCPKCSSRETLNTRSFEYSHYFEWDSYNIINAFYLMIKGKIRRLIVKKFTTNKMAEEN